ncbi:MAG: hypothetical protein J1E97_07345 [Muribaculaceae bacterium]|nr:hypothetical protein [Muribaculaceae bacterium]
MIKKLLLTLMLGSLSLGASAQYEEFQFTYVTDNPKVNAIGDQGLVQTFDVAMGIAYSSFAGMKAIGITAYLNESDYFEDAKVWLASDLENENQTYLAIKDATLEKVQFAGETLVKVSATFDQPYTFTETPIYAGYSFTISPDVPVTSTGVIQTTDGARYPVITDKNNTTSQYSLFMKTSKGSNYTEWQILYNEMDRKNDYGAALIYVSIEKEDYPGAFTLLNAFPVDDIRAGYNQEFTNSFYIINTGNNPISSITYQYEVDVTNKYEATITFDEPIEVNLLQLQQIHVPFRPIEEDGEHLIDIKFTKVNGQEFHSYLQEASFVVDVLKFSPKNRPLIEEYTQFQCIWCPRGWYAMEIINEEYPDDQVTICYHCGDALAASSVFPMPVSAWPNASINREAFIDPWFGNDPEVFPFNMGIEKNLKAAMNVVPVSDIDVTAEIHDRIITVKSQATFGRDIDNSTYRIGYVLLCNNLQNTSWRQQNAFATAGDKNNPNPYIGSVLEPLVEMGNPIRNLVYNDVAVEVSGMMGVAGSLPTSISALTPYTHEYTINIAGNKLINHRSNLVVAAFVVDYSSGLVDNSNKFYLSEAMSVEGVEADEQPVETTYFDLSGRKVLNPEKGIYVRSQRLGDGSVKTDKIVF